MNKKKTKSIISLTVLMIICYCILIVGAILLSKIYGKLPLFIAGSAIYLIGTFMGFKRGEK